MEKLTTLNYGQMILFGYICTSLSGRTNSELPLSTLTEIIDLILEITNMDNYNSDPMECPDVQIMTNPQNSYEIFCEFFDENENYFVSLTH